MKQEQLSMELPLPPSEQEEEAIVYEPLDFQLADLMQELNGEKNKTLEECVLEISKHTREGQIAITCSQEQSEALLKTEVVGQTEDYKPLILDDGHLYLRRYWQYQEELAQQIKSRLSQRLSESSFDQTAVTWQEKRLSNYFNADNISETEKDEINWQKIAAERALNYDFMILSGGPGTGKTTTITRILALLIEQFLEEQKILKTGGGVLNHSQFHQYTISLAAPTGKAAIRMLDAIREAQQKLNLSADVQALMPKHATTLHKLLGYKHGSVQFKHNRHHLLNTDLVLIDEASMIDIALMSKLFEAVPPQAKLILIGDKDQLSSVETGSVFTDICDGLKAQDNMVTLQKNWRFSKESGIGKLAIAANNSDSQSMLKTLQDKSISECRLLSPSIINQKKISLDFLQPWENYFSVLHNPQSSLAEIFTAFNQFRILCALRRGLSGSVYMNQQLEERFLKEGFINRGKNKNKNWYHGRPVMVTQNSYNKNLFNGDTGITLIKNGETKVYFPDAIDAEEGAFKSISPVRMPAHETTWAMTIHKSQGSEFDHVTLVLPNEIMPLLSKQLIYTGITRAKQKISIVSSTEILEAGINSEVTKATQMEAKLSSL